jgi:hypothetical protein
MMSRIYYRPEQIFLSIINNGYYVFFKILFRENHEREKRELSELNDRFASYIERVRCLEGQNKKLQLEIDHLK